MNGGTPGVIFMNNFSHPKRQAAIAGDLGPRRGASRPQGTSSKDMDLHIYIYGRFSPFQPELLSSLFPEHLLPLPGKGVELNSSFGVVKPFENPQMEQR